MNSATPNIAYTAFPGAKAQYVRCEPYRATLSVAGADDNWVPEEMQSRDGKLVL